MNRCILCFYGLSESHPLGTFCPPQCNALGLRHTGNTADIQTILQGNCDLFTRFMLLNEEQREHGFTDKNFRDTLLNFFLAGRDTTAVTLSWFVYTITVHPRVGDKIFQELLALDTKLQGVNITDNKVEFETLSGEDTNFNRRILQFSEMLTFESLLKLHYLHACIMETLRLYPAVPMVTETLHPNVGVIARYTSPILRHTLHIDLFFGHDFCVLAPNDLRFLGKVLMTIIHLAKSFCNFKK